ncbi:MAG: CehA/McbA family metallohydrolase [Candidatus Hatepunaea meridiana]|nr:CehA/McbA family metallohydrolase [Candidatus Hatepunaea meridiana]
MMDPEIINILPLIGLYAETHYRFRYFPFSRYYRREPEIIFDTPHRLEPNATLPVILIVKDAHRFPVEIHKVTLSIHHKGIKDGHTAGQDIVSEITLNEKITSPFYYKIFDVDASSLPSGMLTVDAKVQFHNGKQERIVHQDNYIGLTHVPFKVLKASEPLPRIPDWEAGELHTHTNYGGDQVEFGAPLEAYQRFARTQGLSWVALTDHSYNIDDYEDNYLKDDPDLKKWNRFQEYIAQLNRENDDVVLLPGEELTCRSATGRNVHMLVIGEKKFISGSGDSAQKWLRTHSELSVKQAIESLSEDTFTAAAHPLETVPILQRLLVGRGNWKEADLQVNRLDGWQILNGNPDISFKKGLGEWKSALIKGQRKYIYAGNDAHGNFNRFRQVRLPMVSLYEHNNHLFGKSLTHIRSGNHSGTKDIINALKTGQVVISNGPALELTIVKDNHLFHTGNEVKITGNEKIHLRYSTSTEFGGIESLKLFSAGDKNENCFPIVDENIEFKLDDCFKGEVVIPVKGTLYLRAELFTRTKEGKQNFAYSNPIWIRE